MRRKKDKFTGLLFATDALAPEETPRETPATTPATAAAGETPGSTGAPAPLSVSQLTRRIRTLLERTFGAVLVAGEVSNFKAHPSGHYYFTLKDAQAQIPAVMFRNANARLKFMPANGMQVTVSGSVQIYEPQGKYQIVCETLEPTGLGALQMAFEQLKRKLAAEGLFDAERKRALPLFPRTVGVVTSPSGAAIRDIVTVLFRRFPQMRLVLSPVPVQGEGAAEKIAAAIDDCNAVNALHQAGRTALPWFDVLIVGRGGGSMEDLWAFNEEVVARAIARSRIPVISAVGHEIDWTIADFVADLRAPTPSAAAELVIEPRSVWQQRIEQHRRRLTDTLAALLLALRRRCERARTHYALREPLYLVNQYRQRVDDAHSRCSAVFAASWADVQARTGQAARAIQSAGHLFTQRLRENRLAYQWQQAALARALKESFGARQEAVTRLLDQVELLGPAAAVKRGYTITRDAATGAAITSARRVRPGSVLRTQFRDGDVTSTVTDPPPDANH